MEVSIRKRVVPNENLAVSHRQQGPGFPTAVDTEAAGSQGDWPY